MAQAFDYDRDFPTPPLPAESLRRVQRAVTRLKATQARKPVQGGPEYLSPDEERYFLAEVGLGPKMLKILWVLDVCRGRESNSIDIAVAKLAFARKNRESGILGHGRWNPKTNEMEIELVSHSY